MQQSNCTQESEVVSLSLSEEIASRARKLSKSELFRFNAYIENYSIPATVVGGWAVYAYNPYLESIDIDVVTPHNRIPDVELILIQQCGWTPTTTDMPIWKRFSKQIPDSGPNDIIIFDLLSTNLVNAFHEDNSKRVPFYVCLQRDYYIRKSIDDRLTISIPKKELLFLYKLKAYRDRVFDFHKKTTDTKEKLRLQAKMTKDLSDTIALMDPSYGPIDLKSLQTLVSNQDLQFLATTIAELPSHAEAIEQYRGTRTTEVQSWVQIILTAF